ncbi:unnamed protein product [Moneuplotes crassus]|uniref:Uncharacterized protein n=1 Tax=Euplotes crassus TaxID=5936 RepID=A0AAD1XJ09_EUPCR|nr:unnamed protein product [Moneuplotes crassus]
MYTSDANSHLMSHRNEAKSMILKRNLSCFRTSKKNRQSKSRLMNVRKNRALLNGNSRFRDHNNQSEKVLHQLADIKIKKLPKVFNYYQEDPDSKMQRSMSLSSHSKGFRIRKSGDKIDIPTKNEDKLSFRSILTTIIERNKRFEQQRPPIDKIRSLILGSKRARERAEKSWKDDRASFTPFVAPVAGPPQEVQGAVQKIRIRIRSKAKTPMIH